MKDLFSVKGKTAIVTGGSRGIGFMIARGFVESGVKTYISSRKADVCDGAAKELSKYGTCLSIPADLSTMTGVDHLAAEFRQKEKSLHILVNNAGAAWGAPIAEFPESGWDKVMDLNVKGVFFLTQRLLPELRAAATWEDPARIINIGSIDGIKVNPTEHYPYSAAKAGLHHMSRALARRLAPENILVNVIAPGPFETKMLEAQMRTMGDAIRDMNPRKRTGTMEDIAGTAIYLSSRASAYTTGAIIPVDGGYAET
jgi:NAD(P)-dependent dehydrogenase (short-subunit alcohol dehydrogenase family)